MAPNLIDDVKANVELGPGLQAKATKGLTDMLIERQRSNQELAQVADVPKVRDAVVNKALLIMNEHLMSKITIEQIATIIGISRRQLDRKMFKEFEVSAADYYQQLKLKQGKWLLKNSSKNGFLTNEIKSKQLSDEHEWIDKKIFPNFNLFLTYFNTEFSYTQNIIKKPTYLIYFLFFIFYFDTI